MSKLTLTKSISKTDVYSNSGIANRHYDVSARVTIADGAVSEIAEGFANIKGSTDVHVATFVKPSNQYGTQPSPTITFPGDPATSVMHAAMSDIADYIDAVEEMVAAENVTE